MVNGLPILEVIPPKSISTGIEFGVQVPGLVTWFEEHQARLESGYTLDEWRSCNYYTRVVEVAMYRLRRAVHLHEEAAVSKAYDKKRS